MFWRAEKYLFWSSSVGSWGCCTYQKKLTLWCCNACHSWYPGVHKNWRSCCRKWGFGRGPLRSPGRGACLPSSPIRPGSCRCCTVSPRSRMLEHKDLQDKTHTGRKHSFRIFQSADWSTYESLKISVCSYNIVVLIGIYSNIYRVNPIVVIPVKLFPI